MPCSAFDAAAGVVNPVVRHRKCNRRIMEKFRSSTGNNPLTFRLFPLRPCCMQAGEPLVNIYLLKNTAVYTCVGHAVGNNERKNYCHADARISFFFRQHASEHEVISRRHVVLQSSRITPASRARARARNGNWDRARGLRPFGPRISIICWRNAPRRRRQIIPRGHLLCSASGSTVAARNTHADPFGNLFACRPYNVLYLILSVVVLSTWSHERSAVTRLYCRDRFEAWRLTR